MNQKKKIPLDTILTHLRLTVVTIRNTNSNCREDVSEQRSLAHNMGGQPPPAGHFGFSDATKIFMQVGRLGYEKWIPGVDAGDGGSDKVYFNTNVTPYLIVICYRIDLLVR